MPYGNVFSYLPTMILYKIFDKYCATNNVDPSFWACLINILEEILSLEHLMTLINSERLHAKFADLFYPAAFWYNRKKCNMNSYNEQSL